MYHSQLIAVRFLFPGTAEDVWTKESWWAMFVPQSAGDHFVPCVCTDACKCAGLLPGVKLCYCKTGQRWEETCVLPLCSKQDKVKAKQQQRGWRRGRWGGVGWGEGEGLSRDLQSVVMSCLWFGALSHTWFRYQWAAAGLLPESGLDRPPHRAGSTSAAPHSHWPVAELQIWTLVGQNNGGRVCVFSH